MAAGSADEPGLNVGQPGIIWPVVAVNRNRMAAAVVSAIDQQPTHALFAHVGKGDFGRADSDHQTYCFEPGDGVSVSTGSAPRSPDAAQSPAHSLVPLTVPTNLQPSGAFGFACEGGLLGAPVCANATTEKQAVMRATSSDLMVVSLSPSALL